MESVLQIHKATCLKSINGSKHALFECADAPQFHSYFLIIKMHVCISNQNSGNGCLFRRRMICSFVGICSLPYTSLGYLAEHEVKCIFICMLWMARLYRPSRTRFLGHPSIIFATTISIITHLSTHPWVNRRHANSGNGANRFIGCFRKIVNAATLCFIYCDWVATDIIYVFATSQVLKYCLHHTIFRATGLT